MQLFSPAPKKMLCGFVESLVCLDANVDDGRLEQLFSVISEALDRDGGQSGGKVLQLLKQGMHSPDVRIKAVSLRLVGHLRGDRGQEEVLSADDWMGNLNSQEPVLRHAVLYAARVGKQSPPPGVVPRWSVHLFDDSVYIQREARAVFAALVAADEPQAVDEFIDMLQTSLSPNLTSLIQLIVAGKKLPKLIAEMRLEMLVFENHQVVGLREAASVVRESWNADSTRIDESALQNWLTKLDAVSAIQLCVELKDVCSKVTLNYVNTLQNNGHHSGAILIPWCRAMPSWPQRRSVCLQTLNSWPNERTLMSAVNMLEEDNVEIDASLVLKAYSDVSAFSAKSILRLRSDWSGNAALRGVLMSILEDDSNDIYRLMAVWTCVSKFAQSDSILVKNCLAAVLRTSDDETALSQAWESIVPFAQDLQIVENVILKSFKSPAVLAAMIEAQSRANSVLWNDAFLDLELKAVKQCFFAEEWICANAACKWLASHRNRHPEENSLIQIAASHWARPVRKSARDLLKAEVADDSDLDATDGLGYLLQPGSHMMRECYDQ